MNVGEQKCPALLLYFIMKHPRWCISYIQMYIIFSHTQHVALQSYFTWPLVSDPNWAISRPLHKNTKTHRNSCVPQVSRSPLLHQNSLYMFINFIRVLSNYKRLRIKKLRGLSPRANYTDRAAAAGRRS